MRPNLDSKGGLPPPRRGWRAPCEKEHLPWRARRHRWRGTMGSRGRAQEAGSPTSDAGMHARREEPRGRFSRASPNDRETRGRHPRRSVIATRGERAIDAEVLPFHAVVGADGTPADPAGVHRRRVAKGALAPGPQEPSVCARHAIGLALRAHRDGGRRRRGAPHEPLFLDDRANRQACRRASRRVRRALASGIRDSLQWHCYRGGGVQACMIQRRSGTKGSPRMRSARILPGRHDLPLMPP